MNKILLAYASKHGCTEECAKTLAEKLDGETTLWNLKDKNRNDPGTFDKIIIGGSIYAGRIQKEVRDFCDKNESILKEKTLGLFICGTSEGDTAKNQLEASYPAALLSSAAVKESFGGMIVLSKMNFLEKKIIKAVAKLDSDMSNLSAETIDRFAEAINKA